MVTHNPHICYADTTNILMCVDGKSINRTYFANDVTCILFKDAVDFTGTSKDGYTAAKILEAEEYGIHDPQYTEDFGKYKTIKNEDYEMIRNSFYFFEDPLGLDACESDKIQNQMYMYYITHKNSSKL